MTKHQAFNIWAPEDSAWSPWAKPVLFAHMTGDIAAAPAAPAAPATFDLPNSFTPPPATARAALVLDLPGPAAVEIALALVARGYRPVPLYNAVPASPGDAHLEAVPVTPILLAIQAITSYLATLSIPTSAPPAFLLDAARRFAKGPLTPGRLDNRSVSLPTDFPSAGFLIARDIREVWLVQTDTLAPQEDLAHTLRRYQQAGLTIRSHPLVPNLPPTLITVATPPWYRVAYQRLLATMGLKRSPLGGFGATLSDGSAG